MAGWWSELTTKLQFRSFRRPIDSILVFASTWALLIDCELILKFMQPFSGWDAICCVSIILSRLGLNSAMWTSLNVGEEISKGSMILTWPDSRLQLFSLERKRIRGYFIQLALLEGFYGYRLTDFTANTGLQNCLLSWYFPLGIVFLWLSKFPFQSIQP